MPYVKQEDRVKYAKITNQIYDLEKIETKGDLEYLIFVLMQKFMATREKRYSTLHEVVYAVIHAGEEYKRRYLDKREDQALDQNGDI